jgi:[acyl-carrier-protein] S-malonyltransferase
VAAAGLSLGEYTALTFAGVMSFADGLRLVQRRGQAMQAASDATPSGMVSLVGLDQARVEQLCATAGSAGLLRIANFLCPGNLVLSGDRAACDAAEKLAAEAGVRSVRLAVAGAFHTPLMQSAVEALTGALEAVPLREPRTAVWANVTAAPYRDVAEVRALLARQVVEPVLWEQSMRGLLAAGCERFYEIGPGRVLAGLLKRVQRKAEIRNVSA